jgi:hypothetical protein
MLFSDGITLETWMKLHRPETYDEESLHETAVEN